MDNGWLLLVQSLFSVLKAISTSLQAHYLPEDVVDNPAALAIRVQEASAEGTDSGAAGAPRFGPRQQL